MLIKPDEQEFIYSYHKTKNKKIAHISFRSLKRKKKRKYAISTKTKKNHDYSTVFAFFTLRASNSF